VHLDHMVAPSRSEWRDASLAIFGPMGRSLQLEARRVRTAHSDASVSGGSLAPIPRTMADPMPVQPDQLGPTGYPAHLYEQARPAGVGVQFLSHGERLIVYKAAPPGSSGPIPHVGK
jgi:hypothetical protein